AAQPPKSSPQQADGASVSGELKQWHRVTLTFREPQTDENALPNPFRDFRLNVTFASGEQRLIVRGHCTADGNAAEWSAAAGNCWQVHIAPPANGPGTPRSALAPTLPPGPPNP